jgi:hypothetical protein
MNNWLLLKRNSKSSIPILAEPRNVTRLPELQSGTSMVNRETEMSPVVGSWRFHRPVCSFCLILFLENPGYRQAG